MRTVCMFVLLHIRHGECTNFARLLVCLCVRRRGSRRDFYCVSENSFSVCDHCGVTHAASGLEVFLMDPRFPCRLSVQQYRKLRHLYQSAGGPSQMLWSADIVLIRLFFSFFPLCLSEGAWKSAALAKEKGLRKSWCGTFLGKHLQDLAGCTAFLFSSNCLSLRNWPVVFPVWQLHVCYLVTWKLLIMQEPHRMLFDLSAWA